VNFLQWLTIAFTAFLFLLVLTYWFGWSKPDPGKDYRWQMLSALLGIEGLLIGVFLQENRVQDKERQVIEAREVVANSSRNLTRLEDLTNRLGRQVEAVPAARASVDSIKTVISNTRRLQAPVLRIRPTVGREQ